MSDLDYRAIVTPTPTGGWAIMIEEYWIESGRRSLSSNTLHRINGGHIDTYAWARTERKARKKVERLLARHRKALANRERKSFEVD